MTRWELVQRRDIRSNGIELALGMSSRQTARAALAATMSGPMSHFPDDGDLTDDCTWIRLRYDEDALLVVEFLWVISASTGSRCMAACSGGVRGVAGVAGLRLRACRPAR